MPIIVRDTHRQRRQISQPAFSDAYLSGMPSKRRKIVTNAKPQGSLPQVIQGITDVISELGGLMLYFSQQKVLDMLSLDQGWQMLRL